MKKIRIGIIILFYFLLAVPVFCMNFEENVVSEIDNRMLVKNPFVEKFGPENKFSDSVENYVSDRIGFRDEIITGYTIANDKLFGEMVHPSYMYGKDGYVFGSVRPYEDFEGFPKDFADMMIEIKRYCDERDIPFLFVLEPTKASVMEDKLPEGMHYSDELADELLAYLRKNGVDTLYIKDVLLPKYQEGEDVFNVKYDANHWNSLGAFYGVNAMAEKIKEHFPGVHVNTLDEFDITEELQTSLLVSKFPIHEYVPVFSYKDSEDIQDVTEEYNDIVERHPDYTVFFYTKNEKRKSEGAPKVLVFQGSYMNGKGHSFMDNCFGEYIAIHDYENVLNFQYYYDMFEPECIIFEVSEMAVTKDYFDHQKVIDFKLD